MTTTSPLGRTEPLRPGRGPVRVLIVDDEDPPAELLSMALRYEGWEVRSAGDGASAVRTARDFRPDAVVLDVGLPGLGGLAVLGRLRHELSDVPVLFLTGRDSVEDRIAALELRVGRLEGERTSNVAPSPGSRSRISASPRAVSDTARSAVTPVRSSA